MAPDRFEDFGMVNLLKAGIQYADAVTTVSPTYAQRNPRADRRHGPGALPQQPLASTSSASSTASTRPSGIRPPTNIFPPATAATTWRARPPARRRCRNASASTVDPKIPLFGIVSRFAPQKGFDLIRGALPQALRDMVMQVVVLGTGDPFTENFFRWLHGAFPKSANAHIGFVPELAHLIEAGSDFFIMPSLYEPCGLNQMYSSLYGTLPIVRATGGLDDTVENYNEARRHAAPASSSGKFPDARSSTPSAGPSRPGLTAPTTTPPCSSKAWRKDFTWESSARQYESVYEHALAHRARPLGVTLLQNDSRPSLMFHER